MPKKGSAFERDFCRRLSLWWSAGLDDAIFWRTSTSGARATVRGRKDKRTKNQCGDVCATNPVGQPFIEAITLELKRGYSKYTCADLLDASPSAAEQLFESWVVQAITSSELAATPYWMIVCQRDRRETLAFIPLKLFRCFWGENPFDVDVTPLLVLRASTSEGLVTVAGMHLEDWFKFATPDLVRALSEGA